MRVPVLAFLALLASSGCATTTTSATAQPGMVSAADPRAARAGAEILRAGGSAADAAFATLVALTVVEPQSSGIGGGGFFVRADPQGRVETIDGRETAPMAAGPEWFFVDGKPLSISNLEPTDCTFCPTYVMLDYAELDVERTVEAGLAAGEAPALGDIPGSRPRATISDGDPGAMLLSSGSNRSTAARSSAQGVGWCRGGWPGWRCCARWTTAG